MTSTCRASSSEPRRSRRAAALAVAIAAALSCGKKGPPRPPEPRGPLPAREVVVRQIGERVVASFTAPAPRGPRPTQRASSVELLRVEYAPAAVPPADPGAFARRGEIVFHGEFDAAPDSRVSVEDPTLAQLPDAGHGWTLRYAIRLRDPRGRPSPAVAGADLVRLAARAAPTGLTAEPTGDGVRLQWAVEADARYNVYRTPVGAVPPERPINTAPITDAQYLDGAAVLGQRYRYAVRRLLAEGEPPRETESSDAFEILAEDRFAPAPPTGLVAVQEGPLVRLFWNPSPERDVVGYRVYRRRGEDEFQALGGPLPIAQPTLLDSDVAVGDRLAYRVTAVDRAPAPNESLPSEIVDVEMLVEPDDPR